MAAPSLVFGVHVSLELHHIQSRPVISRKNSHSCCARSLYPTSLTSTKVPVVNMLFTKITKRPASNHIFPKSPIISEALASSSPQPVCPAVLFPVTESICAYSSTPSRTASLGETKNTDHVSNVLRSFNIFFSPLWQVASAAVNEETSSCKIKLRLLEWRQVSVVLLTMEACSYALLSVLHTNTIADKSMCACLVLYLEDFINQRGARTTD